MTGALVAVLALVAVAVLTAGRRRTPRRGPARPVPERRRWGREAVTLRRAELADQTRVLRQTSALLAAGRPLNGVWTDLLGVRGSPAGLAGLAGRGPGPGSRAGDAYAAGATSAVTARLRVIERASRWGQDPGAVLRGAGFCGPDGAAALADGWAGLADCLDIARTTGAPLADLIDRFATAQDDVRDADAAREAALAGPAATVRILRWLPAAGLGLGTLMGADPLHVLLTTPAGAMLTLTAMVLMVVGHVWVRRMVAVAAA